MTFAELKAALEKLTPEQLARPAYWSGEERGGEIESLGLTEEDYIRDDGDSGEIFSRTDFEESCREYGDADRAAKGVVCFEKGSPLLYTDGVG